MRLAVLFVWGSLLTLAASEGCLEASEDLSSWVRLKPLGHCKEGENTCPYRITLPPLTIQLPKPFREMEKMVRELKTLTQMVNQLKADCRECKQKQRMEWSLQTPGDVEDGETIQASRATVNTKEREQDLLTRVKVVQSAIQDKEEEDTMLISSGTKQVDQTGMEKQERNSSSTRYKDETSGGPTESNPEHKERKADRNKVREPNTFSIREMEKKHNSPKAKLIESYLPGHQDVEQPRQASRDTSNTRERQQDLRNRIKVVQGTLQKTKEEDTMLISSGTKQVNPADRENQRWSTLQERQPTINPNSTRHREEIGPGRKESNPEHVVRKTEVTEPHTLSSGLKEKELQSSKAILDESYRPGHQDEDHPTHAPSGTDDNGRREQAESKRVKVFQGTVQKPEAEADTILISSTKQVDPTDTEEERWDTTQEKDLKQSSARNWEKTSREPNGSSTDHTERRTKSMSKVREPLSHTAKEQGKEMQSPRVKQISSSVSGNQDEQQPTQSPKATVRSKKTQQGVSKGVKVVQGTIPKNEEDVASIHISSSTTQINPTDIENQRWNTTHMRIHNPNSTRHREETSRGPKGPNLAHIDRRTKSMGKVTELHSITAEKGEKDLQSPRAKKIESSLPRLQDKEESRHNHKTGTAKIRQNTGGNLRAQGEIKSIPEVSVVEIVSEKVPVETRQINSSNMDKPIKRFPGFPRLINTNRKEIKLNTKAEDRFKDSGDRRKIYSPVGERAVKTVSRGSGFTPIRSRPSEEILKRNDSREGMDSGQVTPEPYRDASLPDTIGNTSKIKDNKKFEQKRQPVTSAKALNMTEITKTILDQQGEDKEGVRGTGVKESRTVTHANTGDSVLTKGHTVNMVPYQVSENKGENEKSNKSASPSEPKSFNQGVDDESNTEADAKTTETPSQSEDSSTSVIDIGDSKMQTDTQTGDSHSENPLSPWSKAGSETNLNPVSPSEIIRRPEHIITSVSDNTSIDVSRPNPHILDRTSENQPHPSKHADTGMDSVPLNTVSDPGFEKSVLPISGKADSTVDVSLDSKGDLPKGQLKPDFNITRQGSEENRDSNPIRIDTEREKWIRNETLRLDHLKQNFTAPEGKTPVKSVNRQGTPAVGQKVRGKPRISGLIPLKSKEMNPHSVNSTKEKEGARELNHPNLRIVKNITRTNSHHVNQPEKNTPKWILAKNPKLRNSNILQRMPGNGSMERPSKVNSSGWVGTASGLTEHVVDPGKRNAYFKIGPPSTSTKTELRSSSNDLTQTVSSTMATHTTLDPASTERDKIAPTVEVANLLNNYQTQSTSQNTETKLFHVTEPENPGGKRGLDPITAGVREHSVETAMNQSFESHDSNSNSGPDSHQAVIEKTKTTDKKKGTKPFIASSVDSFPESNKIFIRAGGVQNSNGNILPTLEKASIFYPTTAATTYIIKTVIKDKQSQMSKPFTSGVTKPHSLTHDDEEKHKTTSGATVSNAHFQHTLKYSSQEVDSHRRNETSSEGDKRNKELHPVLQSSDKAGGLSKVKVSDSSSMDSVPNRLKTFVIKRVKSTSGPRGSASSTENTLTPYAENTKSAETTVASMEHNNRDVYPVSLDRSEDTKKMKEGILPKTRSQSTSEEKSARPLLANNEEKRDGLEDQLLSTCQGQCDSSPTPQPILNIHRSSESDRGKLPQDCSDLLKKNPKNGVYSVTPVGAESSTFQVLCDMEASAGGWTLIQHRLDGNLSFNRTWNEYKRGFGNLTGEFWLGNDKIHWLTSAKAMVLRIELEDLDGVKGYAQYEHFHVANESQHYRLTIGGYSGTAGNAMQFSKKFNHDQKNFTTPDRDNDRYPSGNCGAYYSSGWWFDACMAANLNGRYYQTRYKGVRNGIFWGSWHNISQEYYPTNARQSFKTVRMMVRPRTTTVKH